MTARQEFEYSPSRQRRSTMSTPNIVWTPMQTPPEWLDKHDNAIWSSDEQYLLIKGCKNCQTTLKVHTCQKVNPVDYVVFWRERGLNQTRVNALFGNQTEELTDAAPHIRHAQTCLVARTGTVVGNRYEIFENIFVFSELHGVQNVTDSS